MTSSTPRTDTLHIGCQWCAIESREALAWKHARELENELAEAKREAHAAFQQLYKEHDTALRDATLEELEQANELPVTRSESAPLNTPHPAPNAAEPMVPTGEFREITFGTTMTAGVSNRTMCTAEASGMYPFNSVETAPRYVGGFCQDREMCLEEAKRLRSLIPGCDCDNYLQCWEPCGRLGHSEKHARVVPPEEKP